MGKDSQQQPTDSQCYYGGVWRERGRISQGTLRVKPLRNYPFPVIAHIQSVDVAKFLKLNALSVRKFTVLQSSMLQYDATATVN